MAKLLPLWCELRHSFFARRTTWSLEPDPDEEDTPITLARPERKIETMTLAAVLAVALLWRVLVLSAIQNTPLAFWHSWDQSDMHSFWTQAQALAAGDWLARIPYHPYHHWMRVAPAAAWAPFFARPAFYQAPLYSYFLAALMALKLDAAAVARVIQLLLGVAGTGLVYGVTRRLFGRGAALAAGMLAAVYSPLLVVESQLLRDTLVLFLTLIVFYRYQSWTCKCGARSVERGEKHNAGKMPALLHSALRAPRSALLLGLPLGVLAMAHEGAGLLALAILVAGMLRLRRAGWGVAARWAVFLFLGMLVGYGPLLVRNLAVGAPALPRFAGSAFAWAVANHADAPYGGATWIAPGAGFGEVIAQSHGGVGGLVGGVLGSYHGAWWRWLGHWAERLAALGIGAENNENVCQAYFARRVPILAFTVDFRVLLPLALAGAFIWGRRRWATALRRGSVAGALCLNALAVAGMLSMVLPLGRYRLMLLPALLPWAGLGLARLWSAVHGRRLRRLGLLAGMIALCAAGQWGLGRALPFGGVRPVDYQVAAKILMDWGRPDLAREELLSGAEATGRPELFELELGLAEEGAGAEYSAARRYVGVLGREPDQPLALARLAWLRTAAHDARVRHPEAALALARRYAAAPERAALTESDDLLGAACAAAGDFTQARAHAERALAAARGQRREALAAQIEARLALYRQGRAYIR